MSREYTLPARLRLTVDHLNAVRTLDAYVRYGELEDDMRGLTEHLRQKLASVLQPARWEGLYQSDRKLYSSPIDKPRWKVLRDDDCIALEIYLAEPVGEYEDDEEVGEPYVNLYVPPEWEKRVQFTDALKPEMPSGFQHVSEGEFTEETSIFTYIPYTHYATDGIFDLSAFIDGFREAAAALVKMESTVDSVLERLA